MIINTINGITRLTATDGMVLTNGTSHGTEVWLSPQDSADNWRETDVYEPADTDPEQVIAEMEEII